MRLSKNRIFRGGVRPQGWNIHSESGCASRRGQDGVIDF
jgi:hypothetical protein